jgi:lysyl-tRNA synthetase class II
MIFVGMVKAITGGTKVTYHPDGPDGEAWEIDFTPPFKKLDLMADLEKALGVKLPDADKLDTPGIYVPPNSQVLVERRRIVHDFRNLTLEVLTRFL